MFEVTPKHLWSQLFGEYEIGREINGYEWVFHPREDVRYPVRVFCYRLGIKTIGM